MIRALRTLGELALTIAMLAALAWFIPMADFVFGGGQ